MKLLLLFCGITIVGATYPLGPLPHHRIDCRCDDSFTYHEGAGINKKRPKLEITDKMIDEIKHIEVQSNVNLKISENGLDNFMPIQDPVLYEGPLPYRVSGWDPACHRQSKFESSERRFQDHYLSDACGTIPRERAIGFVMNTFASGWRHGIVHESTLNPGRLSNLLKIELHEKFIRSQTNADIPCGDHIDAVDTLSVSLERQDCLEDETFDLVITQDVFEHVYDAKAAFKEIARTLKPGGMHIFTTPLACKRNPSYTKATFDPDDGHLYLHSPPEIHATPNGNGSIVTTMWGYDIADFIDANTGMTTKVVHVNSKYIGVEYTELIEVIVSIKPGVHHLFHPLCHGGEDCLLQHVCNDTFISCNELSEGGFNWGRKFFRNDVQTAPSFVTADNPQLYLLMVTFAAVVLWMIKKGRR